MKNIGIGLKKAYWSSSTKKTRLKSLVPVFLNLTHLLLVHEILSLKSRIELLFLWHFATP